MIFRLAAAVVDAWLALRLGARELWRGLPGDLLGRLVLRATGTAATRTTTLDGLTVVVVEDALAARYLDAMPIRPTAQTLGRFVVARRPIAPAMLAHELEHVRQWQRLGPLFLPAYLLSSGIALARRDHPYWANRFEAAARRAGEAAEAGPPEPGQRPAAGEDARISE